jgi:prepilin-type N-terminal cleavage/methylation domain-containing protein
MSIVKNYKKSKSGFSIIELVVAMAIFLVVITLAVGAFVSVSRMKALTSTMKEAQQKTRIVLEKITRLARQAEKIKVTNSGNTVVLYYNLKTSPYAYRFQITDDNKLLQSECSGSIECTTWSASTELYEGITLLNDSDAGKDSKFVVLGSIPPTLSVDLYGKISNAHNNPYYSNEINLNTIIILEAIK